MGDRSRIEWTETTWNPTTGCDRISPGCERCYALTMAKRLKAMASAKYQTDGDPRTSGRGFGVAVHKDTLTQPLRWRSPRKVFVDSMSDLGHARIPGAFVARVFAVMLAARQHSFQVLTKRPGRFERLLSAPEFQDRVLEQAASYGVDRATAQWPASNVWVGTSIESDDYCWRAEVLRRTSAAVRFLSLEPLLGPLPNLDLSGIDWVIAGGESGHHARPMHPDWVRDIRDRCNATGTPFFFKQWGAWQPVADPADDGVGDQIHGEAAPRHPRSQRVALDGSPTNSGPVGASGATMVRARPSAADRTLDGRSWNQLPSHVSETLR